MTRLRSLRIPVAVVVIPGFLVGWLGASMLIGHRLVDASAVSTNCGQIEVWEGTSAGEVKDDDADNVIETNGWLGRGGDDTLRGMGCGDDLSGNEGGDTIQAGAGDDVMHGYVGNDSIFGGAGFDNLYGGDNADDLSDAEENDSDDAYGEDNGDYVSVIDQDFADLASGGAGTDTCIFDKSGSASDDHHLCETLIGG